MTPKAGGEAGRIRGVAGLLIVGLAAGPAAPPPAALDAALALTLEARR